MARSKLSSFSLLWVTDPWSTLAHSQDTTLRLIEESLNLGVQTYWSSSDFVANSASNRLQVILISDGFKRESAAQTLFKSQEVDPSKFHQIHYRVDPPVDFNYISGIEKILQKGAAKNQILNPIDLIAKESEKIPPKALSHLAPKLQVIQDASQVSSAYEFLRLETEVVTKPLNLAQSIGVKKWSMPKTESEFEKLIKSETENFTHPIVVEEYLADIQNGEVRIWFCFGKIIAALKKHPKKGDFRVLIDEGSKVEAYHLSAAEEKIALEVGSILKQDGVGLAAIDFIGGKICDYNITSPGLLVQLEEVHQKNFAKEIIENLLGIQGTN